MNFRKMVVSYEIRVLLRHYWKQNFKANETAQKLCEVEGEETITIEETEDWFNKFNAGDISLQMKEDSGHYISMIHNIFFN